MGRAQVTTEQVSHHQHDWVSEDGLLSAVPVTSDVVAVRVVVDPLTALDHDVGSGGHFEEAQTAPVRGFRRVAEGAVLHLVDGAHCEWIGLRFGHEASLESACAWRQCNRSWGQKLCLHWARSMGRATRGRPVSPPLATVDACFGSPQFEQLLFEASAALYAANHEVMDSGGLLPTTNVVDPGDVALFFRGVDAGLVDLRPDGRFNTADRPTAVGRWALLSRSRRGGWFNAEYLPQLAAYIEAILDLGYPRERVLFELPAQSLQLDLAILDDQERVVVLGEAKRSTSALAPLARGVVSRFFESAPSEASKRRGDEQRQLAWRLWTVAPQFTWLIGPGHREAFRTRVSPLRLDSMPQLPHATALKLDHVPPTHLGPPTLN